MLYTVQWFSNSSALHKLRGNHDVNQYNMLYNVVMHKETMQTVVTELNTDLIAHKKVHRIRKLLGVFFNSPDKELEI